MRPPPRRRSEADVALVTYRAPHGVPPEDWVLARALRRLGVSVVHPVWDDPSVDWSAFGVTVVRSTWDYWPRRPEFLRWVERASRAGSLWNPPHVLRWNTDKGYLRDLARVGVSVVPTVWCPRGRPIDLRAEMDRRRWTEVVVKPAISAAGDRTYRVPMGSVADGQRKLDAIARTGVAMVQPYLPSEALGGERSLVYLDGTYSHTVRRVPIFDRRRRRSRETLGRASAEMRRLAESALAASPGPLMYARIDLIADQRGRWQLLEAELTEPSLFFVPRPRAADTLARAIRRSLAR